MGIAKLDIEVHSENHTANPWEGTIMTEPQPPIVSGNPNDWQPPIMPTSPPTGPSPRYVVQPQPIKKHTARNVLLIVLVALVGLCAIGTIAAVATSGKKPSVTSTTGAPAAPAAAPKATAYTTTQQIIDALDRAGLGCGTGTPVAPANGAMVMVDCGQIVISVYATGGAAVVSRDVLNAVMQDSSFVGFAVTFGPWLINAGKDQAYAQKVADLFHGELTTIGAAKPSPTLPARPAVPTITDGTWTVGEDFPAGVYKTTGSGDSCYWGIFTSGHNQSFDSIVDNHIGGGNLRVTLKAGQDFQTERCGPWTKVG